MCFLCAFQISKSRTPISKIHPVFTPESPLILASPVFAILKNVIALYLCAFYVLFGYLRAEPLFQKFTLFSPLSHPLILASPVFTILKNVIALYLCAFRISKSRTPISKIPPVFTPVPRKKRVSERLSVRLLPRLFAPKSLGSDPMHDSRRDSLRDSFLTRVRGENRGNF